MGALAAAMAAGLPSKVLSAGWSTAFTDAPARTAMAVSTDGTRLYYSHGLVSGNVVAGGVAYTPGGSPAGLPAASVARQGVSGVWCNGRHYAIGGLNASNAAILANEAYTPAGADGASGTWATRSTSGLGSRAYASAAAVGTKIYLAGGQNGSSASNASASVFVYDTTTDTWTTAANAMPAARTQGAMVAVGTKLYYLGGQNTAGDVTKTVYIFDTVAGTWSTGTALGREFGLVSAAAIGDTVYMWGRYYSAGTSGTATSAVMTYDVTTKVSALYSPQPSAHGDFPGVVAIGSTVYLVSGSGTANIDKLDTAAAAELTGNPSRYQKKLRALRSFLLASDPAAGAVACRIPETMPAVGTAAATAYVRDMAILKQLALAGPA